MQTKGFLHKRRNYQAFIPACWRPWWWWQYDGNVDERGYVWGNWCRQKGFLHKRRNYQAFIPTFCCCSSSRWWSSSLKLRSQGIIWMGFKLIWIELLSTSDMRRYRQHHKHHLRRHQHHYQASKSANWFPAPDKSVPFFFSLALICLIGNDDDGDDGDDGDDDDDDGDDPPSSQ